MNVSSYIDHHRDENLTGMMIAAFLEIIAIIFACAIQKVNASANKAFDSYITKESREKTNVSTKWLCPKCGDHIDDNDIELLSSPTEEASYPDDDLEPEPEWYD